APDGHVCASMYCSGATCVFPCTALVPRWPRVCFHVPLWSPDGHVCASMYCSGAPMAWCHVCAS
ncbi:hypothetical protein NDU88_000181, partial [Pleurodeles waltl]